MARQDWPIQIDTTTPIRQLCAGIIHASAHAELYEDPGTTPDDARRALNVHARVLRHRLYETIVAVSRLRDAAVEAGDPSHRTAGASAMSGLTDIAEALHEIELRASHRQ